jgi:hypothetical protein
MDYISEEPGFDPLEEMIGEVLFAAAPDRFDQLRRNPVTETLYCYLDPIGEQKRAALRALRARVWFERTGPRDAPPLPLCSGDREALKRVGGISYIVSLFDFSLMTRDYAYDEHPSFYDFARGVLASLDVDVPYILKHDPGQDLQILYPPRPLPGLKNGVWTPVERPSCKPRRSRSR